MRRGGLACAAVALLWALPAPAEAAPRGASQVQLSVGPGPRLLFPAATYLPVANTRVRVEVAAAGRRGRRVLRRKLRARFSYGGRCGKSFAAGNGRPLRLRTARNPEGRRVYRSGFRRFRETTQLRFCLWFSRSRRARVGAVARTVEVPERMFGAAMAYVGALAGFAPDSVNLVSSAASTAPYRETSRGPCPTDEPETSPATFSSNFNGLYGSSIRFGSFPEDCATPFSISYDTRPGLPPRALSYTAAEYRGSKPIKATGDCFTGAAQSRNVAEARLYIRSVGCRPGRVFRRNAVPRRDKDEVFLYEVGGGRAVLVPRGTVIDMVAQR